MRSLIPIAIGNGFSFGQGKIKLKIYRWFTGTNIHFQLLSIMQRKATKKIVYVIPKFSINKVKKVIIELNEFGGERNVTISVPMNVVNNPK